jgi:hypothetical protein
MLMRVAILSAVAVAASACTTGFDRPDGATDTRTDPDTTTDAAETTGPRCGYGMVDCDADHVCETPEGTCSFDTGAIGTCVEIPDPCDGTPDPECGCDGVTYQNPCHRRQARQDLAHRGECEVPRCGPSLPGCPGETFCEYPAAMCVHIGAMDGECVAPPTGCTGTDPQCGCDGATYADPCERLEAGMALDHPGACGTSCTRDEDCGPSWFCDMKDCDPGTTFCVPVPEDCPDIDLPVCSCDGVDFMNDCFRRHNHASFHHLGPC